MLKLVVVEVLTVCFQPDLTIRNKYQARNPFLRFAGMAFFKNLYYY